MKRAFRISAVALFFIVLIGFVYIAVNFDSDRLQDINHFWNKTETGESTTTKLYAGNPRFPENAELYDLAFTPNSNFVKTVGRTYTENGTVWFSMSGSGISFLCDGSSVTVTCVVHNSYSVPYNHRPRIIILVNGEVAADEVLDEETTEITADLSSVSGDAEVQVVKASEAMYSTVGVSEIRAHAKGDICPAPQRAIKIEFIGDSITAGYGLDEENPNAAFSTRTENFTETYAFLASQNLAADCNAVAFSGYGVYTGFSSNGQANDYVIFNHYNSVLSNFEGAPDWNFYDYKPNIVVINLGTNDASYCSTQSTVDSFVSEYKRLLSVVRERNTGAYILCVLGDMNNSLYSAIERAVGEYQSETSDFLLKCATLSFDMGTYGSAIDGHPNKDSNVLAAKTLESEIKSLPLSVS